MSWRVLKHIHCFGMSFTHDILKRPATNPGILVLMGGYIRIYVGILINHDGHPYESANEHIQQCILTVKQCSCVNLLKKSAGFLSSCRDHLKSMMGIRRHQLCMFVYVYTNIYRHPQEDLISNHFQVFYTFYFLRISGVFVTVLSFLWL